jgi:hypothetical protein
LFLVFIFNTYVRVLYNTNNIMLGISRYIMSIVKNNLYHDSFINIRIGYVPLKCFYDSVYSHHVILGLIPYFYKNIKIK